MFVNVCNVYWVYTARYKITSTWQFGKIFGIWASACLPKELRSRRLVPVSVPVVSVPVSEKSDLCCCEICCQRRR